MPHNLVKVLTDRMRDRTILCGSASKAYSMTGWRCGWILGPKDVVTAADTLQGHSTSNVASISQKAALQALTGSQDPVGAMLSEYKTRRDKLMEWFSDDPRFECVKPRGRVLSVPAHHEGARGDGHREHAATSRRCCSTKRASR